MADETKEFEELVRPSPAQAEQREAAVRGLRELADAIEQNPEMPMPHFCEYGSIDIWAAVASTIKRDSKTGEALRDGDGHVMLETELEFMARVARAVPGKIEKGTENGDGYFTLRRDFGPIKVVYSAARDEVCTRRQVGTEKETKLVTVQTETKEVEVPVYEWDCHPILSRAGK